MSPTNLSSDQLSLLILSAEEVLYSGPAFWVEVPLLDGLIGIWPGHAPFVGAMARGVVRYQTTADTQELPVGSGALRVTSEQCVVLVGLLSTEGDKLGASNTEQLFEDLESALGESLVADELSSLREEG